MDSYFYKTAFRQDLQDLLDFFYLHFPDESEGTQSASRKGPQMYLIIYMLPLFDTW
jgi:hypothetical protein